MTNTLDDIRARFQPPDICKFDYKILAVYDGFLWGSVLDYPVKWTMNGQQINHYGTSPFNLILRDTTRELIEEARKMLNNGETNYAGRKMIFRLSEALEQAQSK